MSLGKAHAGIALYLLTVVALPAANINRYDDRPAFEADTSSRVVTDFDTLANGCVGIPDKGGLTVNNINFNGGVNRSFGTAPCRPTLTGWKGIVLSTRLVIRQDVAAYAYTTVTLPAGVMAVGFDTGVDAEPVNSRIQVTLVTSDNREQTFTVMGKGTGSGGSRRMQPVFAGFTSSRAISSIRFSIPDIIDSILILDNFTVGQTAPPVINTSGGVVHGASFLTALAPNSWVTIFGRLLSSTSRPWSASDFSGSRMPTEVEDVSVTVNGKPAYICYVSPGQVNALLPVDLAEGPAIVQLARGDLKSAPVSVQMQRVAPALFLLEPENRRYAIATHLDGSLVGKTSLYPGASTPARPGETVTLWGAGFGATTPPVPAGEVVTVPGALAATPAVSIGGAAADVSWAGLSATGLYQLNVVIPGNLPNGDAALSVQVEGARTQTGVYLTIQQ